MKLGALRLQLDRSHLRSELYFIVLQKNPTSGFILVLVFHILTKYYSNRCFPYVMIISTIFFDASFTKALNYIAKIFSSGILFENEKESTTFQ
jgi:hypothetical protein